MRQLVPIQSMVVGGTNTIDFSNASSAVNVNLTAGTTSGWNTDTISNFTKVVASSKGDTITGTAGADSIVSGAGNDSISAGAGNDTVISFGRQ